MAAQNLRRDVFRHTSPITLSVADTILFRVGVPIRIMRWRLIVTTAIADAAGDGWSYAIDRRPTPGSDTGRVEIDEMDGAAAEGQAVGKCMVSEVGTAATSSTASDGSTVVAGGDTGHDCNPGDEIVFEVKDAAATAGAAVVEIEYILLGHKDNTQTDVVNK